ncbi:hypothetical protein BGZ80_010209 [Entomortierella chlamydospora]|uniref:Uncharacterized protein n=1 Tax=Entomortierella chlamydospora TaxID=101097 RepID=A0A9P6SZX0_9FUNG|nr:hypothetical protein BGZ80_010209 [Entomortierella chlamydospora]
MKLIYSPILVLAAALVAVKADLDEQKMATKIHKIVCEKTDPSPEWYSCISCCQGMEPYYSRYNPSALTRDLLDPNAPKSPNQVGIPFSLETKNILCNNMVEYATVLKNIILDVKGPLKPETSTAAGMEEFYQNKTDCFVQCDINPLPKTDCQPFTPNNAAPGYPAALNYYGLYKKYGSSGAVAKALEPPCDKLPITDPANCRKTYVSKYGWN